MAASTERELSTFLRGAALAFERASVVGDAAAVTDGEGVDGTFDGPLRLTALDGGGAAAVADGEGVDWTVGGPLRLTPLEVLSTFETSEEGLICWGEDARFGFGEGLELGFAEPSSVESERPAGAGPGNGSSSRDRLFTTVPSDNVTDHQPLLVPVITPGRLPPFPARLPIIDTLSPKVNWEASI